MVDVIREPRERVLSTRVSVEEEREIERMAANERMRVSEYIRAATLSYMALRGNKLAWRLLGESLLSILRESARKTAAL